MRIENKTILIVSNEPWGDMWYSKHHYANELSKLGYIVYFVNPPKKWSLMNLFNFRIVKQQINSNLHVINYVNNLPNPFQNEILIKLNDILTFLKLKKNIQKNDALILWSFDPFRFLFSPFFKNIKRIYHVVDPYMDLKNDQKLALLADLIICTSKDYIEYYLKFNSKVIFIPHGLSNEELIANKETTIEIKKKHGDFLILAGTIYDGIDFNLLHEISKKHKLVILGKEELDVDTKKIWLDLLKSENIIYLGIINGLELKNYISAAKICLISYDFKRTKIIGVGTPLKILNYLAQHKPIITSIDYELKKLENIAIYKANNVTEYLNLIDKLINIENIDKHSIDTYLMEVTYPNLINKIINQL